jgi:hypothetical protein
MGMLQLGVLVTALISFCAVAANPQSVLFSKQNDGSISLENGYSKFVFDGNLVLSEIFADFNGQSQFTQNILSKPYELEIAFASSSTCNSTVSGLDYSIVKNTDEIVELKFHSKKICESTPVISEVWTASLAKSQRFLSLNIAGSVLKTIDVVSISHGLYVQSASIYGLFDRGVVQMMNNKGKCLGSNQSISRVYWVGNGTALDYLRDDDTSRNIVMISQGSGFEAGIQDVIAGQYPRISLAMQTAWSRQCWQDAVATTVKEGFSWNFNIRLGPNDMAFPVYLVPDASTQPKMPTLDIQTFLMGVYPSAVGCLQSYYEGHWGTVAPTISHPDIGYDPDTNFFDPDNYITLSSMMYSGDKYLLNEVKLVLERTADTMCGIGSDQDERYCGLPSTRAPVSRKLSTFVNKHVSNGASISRTGQLMHHFVNLIPTYESIASSEQLGPNVFWSLAVINYADVSGDYDWLMTMYPYLDLSARFLVSFYESDMGMLRSPGPLWIDVLVRENYTSDSNAIAPFIFKRLAETFDALGQNKDLSQYLREISDNVIENMNQYLWDESDNDHYITQLNMDGTTRDFIDYDANLLAVAFDVSSLERSKSILTRVDSGQYTHIRGTWCCEIPYTGDANDCYIVGGTVCGDSVVTLG